MADRERADRERVAAIEHHPREQHWAPVLLWLGP